MEVPPDVVKHVGRELAKMVSGGINVSETFETVYTEEWEDTKPKSAPEISGAAGAVSNR